MEEPIYIAGPMTGCPGWNYDNFNAEADRLRQMGYEVINPAEGFNGNTDLPRATYLRSAYESVLRAGSVYVLPGWRSSLGATSEVMIAHHINTPVYVGGADPERLPEKDFGCILLEMREIVLGERNSKVSEKLFIMPLHVKDFLTDEAVCLMTNEELGAYIRLLAHCWLERSLPNDDEALARLSQSGEKWSQMKSVLLKKFEQKGERLYNRRQRKERSRVRNYIKTRQLAAKKRWGK